MLCRPYFTFCFLGDDSFFSAERLDGLLTDLWASAMARRIRAVLAWIAPGLLGRGTTCECENKHTNNYAIFINREIIDVGLISGHTQKYFTLNCLQFCPIIRYLYLVHNIVCKEHRHCITRTLNQLSFYVLSIRSSVATTEQAPMPQSSYSSMHPPVNVLPHHHIILPPYSRSTTPPFLPFHITHIYTHSLSTFHSPTTPKCLDHQIYRYTKSWCYKRTKNIEFKRNKKENKRQ